MPLDISVPLPADDVVVECRNLVLRLGKNEILKGCDLALRRHSVAVVFGRSGSGKTTLLKSIAGYLKPTSGSIHVTASVPPVPARNAAMRGDHVPNPILGIWTAHGQGGRTRSFLYADPSPSAMMFADDTNLLPQLTAAENLMLALAPINSDAARRQSLVSAALSLVGLSNVARHKPSQLSSGQKRRLSLAQSLIRVPQFVVLDEPTSALDTRTKFDMLSLIQDLQMRVELTGLIVTHDIDTVLMLADEIVYFDDGRVQKVERVDIPKPREPQDLDWPVYIDIRRRLVDFLMARSLP